MSKNIDFNIVNLLHFLFSFFSFFFFVNYRLIFSIGVANIKILIDHVKLVWITEKLTWQDTNPNSKQLVSNQV